MVFAILWLISVALLVEGDTPETAQTDDIVDTSTSQPIAEPAQKEPSRKERKAAEKAKEQANKEAELMKEDLQRQSTLIGNSSNRPIISNGWSRMDIYTNCQILLQNSLKSPKSFDSSIRTVKFIRDAEKEIIGVNFDFYATNSFGAELIHSGTCVYNFDGELLESAAKPK